jgi:hypothetical protein
MIESVTRSNEKLRLDSESPYMSETVSPSVERIFAELKNDRDLSYDIRHAYEKAFA